MPCTAATFSIKLYFTEIVYPKCISNISGMAIYLLLNSPSHPEISAAHIIYYIREEKDVQNDGNNSALF
jgi:hypothetical protein